ncbi:serine/threonine protein kinase [bacterium]|nr:serine/threonine protein kinase [bacterium]
MTPNTLSHYKILEKLGEGGMGIVYKAEDIRLKRKIAVKLLPVELTRDQDAKKRLIREAQNASSLDHPHIGTIYEIDETDDGRLFIAMAYYEGQTLKQKIDKGPLKMNEAVEWAIQVAEGLAAAHQKEIVHRDIKPANIMITPGNMVKILDFGLAKLQGQTQYTREGTTPGTIAYMSPEQLRGEKVDRRTDIWSLGVVLYEMTTGRRPFKGEYDQAVSYSILNDEPEPITALRSQMPVQLDQIVGKALAKDRKDRYQHVDEIPVDLKGIRFDRTASRMLTNSNSRTNERETGRLKPSRFKSRIRSPFAWLPLLLFGSAAVFAFWRMMFKDLPVIVLMDSPITERVYDSETRANHGTNADDINDILRDLPVVLHKETVTSTWHREDQIIKQNPALLIVHRSCFYDGAPFSDVLDTAVVRRVYELSEGKLIAFLGYVAIANPRTKFLVYSRSFEDESLWIEQLSNRFSRTRGKVTAMTVAGGRGPAVPGEAVRSKATFRDPETARQIKSLVKSLMNIKEKE